MPTEPTPDAGPDAAARPLWRRLGDLLDPPDRSSQLTVWWFLRGLGLIYSVAFLALVWQGLPLLGRGGLLPAHLYLERIAAAVDLPWWEVPSLFWLGAGDGALQALAWIGLALSVLLLVGHATSVQLLALWAIYLSFVNVGQVFFGYGWEILLLEAGFLAVFLVPAWRAGWRVGPAATNSTVLWLLRWLLFRVVFGAGLIKLRGDACWRDLSCLLTHFETQPLPNPLSPWFDGLPQFVLSAGVVVNHVAELLLPLWLFAPPPARRLAGAGIAAFMALIAVSGNFAWFNWLALLLCLAAFDDGVLRRCVPPHWRGLAPAGWGRRLAALSSSSTASTARRRVTRTLVVVVALFSVAPVANLLSSSQVMNTSYDRLHLVNTYGAFGHIGRERREIVLLGTLDAQPTADAEWREYAFPCKPGDPMRRPCVVSPYHLRLDWQMWFAAMADYRTQPWLVHLAYQLLHADPQALSLLAGDPFDGRRPRWIRADLYRYRFAGGDYPDVGYGPGGRPWWERERLGTYLPPLSASDPALRRIVESFGWPLRTPGSAGAAPAAPAAAALTSTAPWAATAADCACGS